MARFFGRIIARSTLIRSIESLAGHKDDRSVDAAISSWFHEVQRAEWKNSAGVKASYAQASIIGADRVVFNIKENSYRLIVSIDFQRSIVFIKWLGTHAAYDKIDAKTVRYGA